MAEDFLGAALPPSVRRLVLLGAESSGKTTLARALAARFETAWVAEYGRELWEARGGVLSEADLLRIAQEQVRREELAARGADRLLFCDTSPLTTAGYSGWMFQRADPALVELGRRRYDAVLLCRPDFPFVQDGTRRDPAFQQVQQAWYLEQLTAVAMPVLQLSGGLAERVHTVAAWIASQDGWR